jgi:hypothetical protein
VVSDVREPVPAPVPVPVAPEAADPVPVSTVPGTVAAAPSPAPAPAARPPAPGDAGDDTPEFALTTDFDAPAPSSQGLQAASSSPTSGAARRAASAELLSSVAGGTVSLNIDLVDLGAAESGDGTEWVTPPDDTSRSARVRAVQDGASRPTPSNDDLALWASKASAALLGAGFVWWSLRASGLLASLAAATPVWRHLDPIPILGGDDGTGHSTFDTAGPPQWDDEAARDEAASRELLDEARRNLETIIS